MKTISNIDLLRGYELKICGYTTDTPTIDLNTLNNLSKEDFIHEILRRMRPAKVPRVGLAIMRCQPFHLAHELIIRTMLDTCDSVIVGIGSVNLPASKQNPWNANHRTQMIQNVFGASVRILQFKDLGTSIKTNDWVNHVLEKIRIQGIVDEPTDYFTGSKQDGLWYAGKFHNEAYGAWTDNHKALDGTLRKIHFIDRSQNNIISATEIRGYLELRDDSWKEYVNPVNHELVETTYPEQFRVTL